MVEKTGPPWQKIVPLTCVLAHRQNGGRFNELSRSQRKVKRTCLCSSGCHCYKASMGTARLSAGHHIKDRYFGGNITSPSSDIKPGIKLLLYCQACDDKHITLHLMDFQQ